MPASAAPKQDRRRSRRVSVIKTGTLIVRADNSTPIFGAENTTLDCHVLDISDGGAKIHAPGLAQNVEGFDLLIGAGAAYRCRVVWRDKQNMGVEFTAKIAPDPGTASSRS